MWSRTFALLVRALRVDARQLTSHVARLALLAFVVMLLLFGQFMSTMWGAPGLWFFTFLSWVNYLFASLAAGLLFATAITEEKEEQTLGLLRMANVGPLPLLLGKGMPRLLAALLILTAQFPFTLLAITLGGVSWDQVHATYWTLFAHLVLVGSIGLFFSVVCRRSFAAATLTLLAILATLIVPPVCYALVYGVASWGEPKELVTVAKTLLPFFEKLYAATATARLQEILTTGFSVSPFGLQVLSNSGVALGLFGLSWLSFEPFNRNLEQAVGGARSAEGRFTRTRARRRRAWSLPLVWKDFYYLAGGPVGWIIRSFLYGLVALAYVWLFSLLSFSSIDMEGVGSVLIGLCLYVFLPLELVVLAARIYRSELRDHTWSTLMQLPCSLSAIAYPKLVGGLLGLAPLVLYFGLGVLLAPGEVDVFVTNVLGDLTGFLVVACMLGHALLFFHMTSLFSVLINAWLGSMLAIAASFVIGMGQLAVFISTMLILSTRTTGFGWDEEAVARTLLVLSTAVLLAASVFVHYVIGVRLKEEAAG